MDRLLGEVIPAELLKQWVLEEVVQWRERLYGPLRTRMLFIEQVMSADHGCQEGVARGICARVVEGRAAGSANTGPYGKARARLPIGLVERLGRGVGQRLVAGQPAAWRWRGREVKWSMARRYRCPIRRRIKRAFRRTENSVRGWDFLWHG